MPQNVATRPGLDAKLGPKGATATTTAPKGLSRMSPKCSKKPPWVEKCRSRPANRYCPSLRKKTNSNLSSAGHLPPPTDSRYSWMFQRWSVCSMLTQQIQYLGCLQADSMGEPWGADAPSGIKSGLVFPQPQDGTQVSSSEISGENLWHGGLEG